MQYQIVITYCFVHYCINVNKKISIITFFKRSSNVEITQQIPDDIFNLQTLDFATLGPVKVKDNECDSNPIAATPLVANSDSKEIDHDEEGKELDQLQEGGRNISINMIS